MRSTFLVPVLRLGLSLTIGLLAGTAAAANIDLIGVFPGKAVFVVYGNSPKTYAVGSTIADNIKLISVHADSAVIDENGKRQTLPIGAHINRAAPSGPATVMLEAHADGHHYAQGQINGITVRMLVDTGATVVVLPASEASRLGIDYKRGKPGFASTANGVAPMYRVKLDTIKVGAIELNQVDASVVEGGLHIILLGNSFLNRMAISREGMRLTLSKRY